MDLELRKKRMRQVQVFIAFFAAIYQLLATKFVLFPTDLHKNIHLSFCLVLVFLAQYDFKKSFFHPKNLISECGIAVSLFVGVYVHTQYFDLIERMGMLNQTDLLVGAAVILFALIASWRDWGWTIPVIVVGAMAYALYGHYLPGNWFHAGITYKRLIGACAMYMSGIYGSLLRISSLEVVMFIMYGAVLDAAGGGDLFIKLAQVCGRRLRSGVAQVAVIGSALFGTISGNIAANVATTGAITIPSMKKSGIAPELAGAIEAVASTGGQLMPPVMGVAAFLIVGITGIPYNVIMKAALFPALAYYLYLGIIIQIRACAQGWHAPTSMEPGKGEAPVEKESLLKNYWHIFISFAALGVCLYRQVAPVLMANYITVTLLAATTLKMMTDGSAQEESLWARLKAFYVAGLSGGILTCAKLTVSICTLGILVEVFVVTGFAQTFAFNMVNLAGNSLLLLSILIFVTCTFFGMGMTASSAYLLVAMLGAPAMVNFGVETLAAHLFCFYYGIMSSVTPPVARGVLVANGMAGGSFWKTAGFAIRLSLPGFLLPFYFVYEPEILWYNSTFLYSLYIFAVVMCGLVAMSAQFEGFLMTKLNAFDRVFLSVIIACSFWPEPITNALAVAFMAVELLIQYQRYRRNTHAAVAASVS